MSSYAFPTETTANRVPEHDERLDEREFAILNATSSHSLSTVAIAEHIGLGSEPLKVVPILERLERLNLIDGYYAAGRTNASIEVHRRYYRSSEQGRLIAASAV